MLMRAGGHAIRQLAQRTAGLTTVALTAACFMPVLAQAAELPGPDPVVPPEAAAALSDVRQLAAPASPTVDAAVHDVAETAGQAAQPARGAVEAAVETTQPAATPDAPPIAPRPERDRTIRPHRPARPKPGPARPPRRGAASSELSPNAPPARSASSSPTPTSPAGPVSDPLRKGEPGGVNKAPDGAGGSAASPLTSSFGPGGLALLVAAFAVGAPAGSSRVRVHGRCLRPLVFVAVLERPG
jgi:hypothetical protein